MGKKNAEPAFMATTGHAVSCRDFSRGLGFSSGYYAGGRDQFGGHLKGQGIDVEYQNKIGAVMLGEAEAHKCIYPPGDYWGLLDADYLSEFSR